LGTPWELFDLAADRTELHDLSIQPPEKLKQLEGQWGRWWSRKNGKLLKSAGKEPDYRRLKQTSEASQ
jgi:arylsulfatase